MVIEINKNIIIKLLSVLLRLSCFFTVANGEVKELNVPEEGYRAMRLQYRD